jgi:hypothetical protein
LALLLALDVLLDLSGKQMCQCAFGLHYPGGITHNVSICVRAGLSKPRVVPDTERTKDTKTLDYASTPLDANTLLAGVFQPSTLK